MKNPLLIIVFAVASLSALSSHASELLLNQFFQNVTTMKANFEQQVVDETGMTLERSRGKFYLSRPGKFRWDYDSADSSAVLGQQIIADGQNIYMFDPDLEQVTQRSMDKALSQVPSLLLVQSNDSIEAHFDIIDFGITDGLSWVALKPTAEEEASYQQLLIGFAAEQMRSIVLLDGLGNETRLQLSQVENNKPLPVATFDFEPPAGADVFVE